MSDRARPEQPDDTAAQLAALVELSLLTYRTVTEQRRRLAAVALVVAILFGALAVVAGVELLQTRRELATVEDRPLVEALGVSVPDPRPAMERAGLRLRAAVYTVAAVASLAICVIALGVRVLVAPARIPASVKQVLGQPPIADISTRGSPPGSEVRSSE